MNMGVTNVSTGISLIWSNLNRQGRGMITEEIAMDRISDIVAATQQIIQNNKKKE